MPLYEYQCTVCNRRYEISQSVIEMEATKDSKRCQTCESPLTKLFSIPTLFTETRFFARQRGDDGFGNSHALRRQAKRVAERAGVSTVGKTFFPSLCRDGERFDPQAWCGDGEDLRRAAVASGQGINNNGLKVEAPPVEIIEEPYRVADHIIERETQEIIDRSHGGTASHAKRASIADQVRADLTPPDMGTVLQKVPVCSHK